MDENLIDEIHPNDERNFNELDSKEQKRLRAYIDTRISAQTQSAQELLQSFQKHIIAANTGGVAATIAFISQVQISEWFVAGLAIFVFGIVAALWWAINLPFRLGAAVGGGNRIRVDVLSSKSSISEVNKKFQKLNRNLSYNSPDRLIRAPMYSFVVGVLVTMYGLTSITLQTQSEDKPADQEISAPVRPALW